MVFWVLTVTTLKTYSFPYDGVQITAFLQFMCMMFMMGNEAFRKITADPIKEKVYVEMPNNAYAGIKEAQRANGPPAAAQP